MEVQTKEQNFQKNTHWVTKKERETKRETKK